MLRCVTLLSFQSILLCGLLEDAADQGLPSIVIICTAPDLRVAMGGGGGGSWSQSGGERRGSPWTSSRP